MIDKRVQHFFLIMYGLSAPLYILRLGASSFYCFDFTVLSIGAYCLCAGAIKPEFRLELDQRYLLLTLFFIVSATISLLLGELSYGEFIDPGEHLDGMLRYSFLFLTTPFIAHYILRTEQTIETLMKLMALSYLLGPLINFFAFVFKWQFFFSKNGRAVAFYMNPNAFGGALVVSLPIYTWLFLKEKGFWKLLGLTGLSLNIIAIILSGSRTTALIAFLIFSTQIGIHIFGERGFLNKLYQFMRPAIAILAFSFFLGLVLQDTTFFKDKGLKRIVEFGQFLSTDSQSESEENYLEKSVSAQHRIDLIGVGLEFIIDRLGGWVGHGINQTKAVLKAKEFPIMGEIHVNLLNLWVETGLMGLGAYGLFLLYLYKNLQNLKKNSPQMYHVMGFIFVSFILIGLTTTHTYLGFYYAPLLPLMITFRE